MREHTITPDTLTDNGATSSEPQMTKQDNELGALRTELKNLRQQLSSLRNLSLGGHYTISAPGLIVQASMTAATMLGMIPSLLTQKRISRFILKEDLHIFSRMLSLIHISEPTRPY